MEYIFKIIIASFLLIAGYLHSYTQCDWSKLDTNQANIKFKQADRWYQNSKADSALFYYQIVANYYKNYVKCKAIDTTEKLIQAKIWVKYFNTQVWIGFSYARIGKRDSALKSLEQALEESKFLYNNENVITANLLNTIANIYLNEYSNTAQAEANFSKALNIRLKELGDSHLDVGNSYNNLGILHFHKGDYHRALNFYKKSLIIRTKNLGNKGILVAGTYNNIGLVYEVIGNTNEAYNYFKKALEIHLKSEKENHLYVSNYYMNIGNIYANKKEHTTALYFYEKSLTIRKNILEPGHPLIAELYNNIAISYRLLGKNEESISYKRKALSIIINRYGSSHRLSAQFYRNVANYFNDIENYAEAKNYADTSIAIYQKIKNTKDILQTKIIIGIAEFGLGKYQAALDTFINFIADYHKFKLNDLHSLILAYSYAGNSQTMLKNYENAMSLYDSAMKIFNQINSNNIIEDQQMELNLDIIDFVTKKILWCYYNKGSLDDTAKVVNLVDLVTHNVDRLRSSFVNEEDLLVLGAICSEIYKYAMDLDYEQIKNKNVFTILRKTELIYSCSQLGNRKG